jgi:hypothetical protein
VPTGNPTIPFTVREAKAIRVLIIEKAEGATGSEKEEFAVFNRCNDLEWDLE